MIVYPCFFVVVVGCHGQGSSKQQYLRLDWRCDSVCYGKELGHRMVQFFARQLQSLIGRKNSDRQAQ